MIDPIFGSLISSGASLLGSLFGGGETQSAGDVFNSAFKAKMKMGEKYGISKLVMAGANAGASPWESAGSNLGTALGDMGQNIGRAIATRQTAPERVATRIGLEGLGLDNELKRAQIRSINSRTLRETAPPIPVPKPGQPWPILPEKLEAPQSTTNYNLPWFGPVMSDPTISDASNVTNRGGESEILEAIMAPIILGRDIAHTIPYKYNDPKRGPSAARYMYDEMLKAYGYYFPSMPFN